MIGDGIGIANINGIWDIVSAFNGVTYLYWNPLNTGSNPRTAWTAYSIGIGDEGTAVEAGLLNNAPVVYECANEAEDPKWDRKPWNLGCVMFQPNGTNYTGTWNRTNLDPSWSAVHEINAAIYPQGIGTYGSNGKPIVPTYMNGFILGEQEQASSSCNSQGYNLNGGHGCRVDYFQAAGDSSFSSTRLSNLGTQNQSIILVQGQFAVAGANHNVYGAIDKALHMWLFKGQTAGGPTLPPDEWNPTPGHSSKGEP